MKILITGGAGFIGSALIRFLIRTTDHLVINLDKLTYAGNLNSLKNIPNNSRYQLEHIDICDADAVNQVFQQYKPDLLMHLAAESHVDRSISKPSDFIQTNIIGTYTLLEAARLYWQSLSKEKKASFRFHHVSTDEVYGDLDSEDDFFTEKTPYAPSSPYSASKASSDHLVRAWYRTYGLPVVISNCSNNYGPFQFPEKLIPRMILNALKAEPLPVFGNGHQVRDWLYVEDHVRALYQVATRGVIGETYNIGGNCEKKNIEVVQTICDLLQEMTALPSMKGRFHDLIQFVDDRPGHDKRYAIDASKIKDHLAWKPETDFRAGLRQTVAWYLQNQSWWQAILDGSYRHVKFNERDEVL